MNFSKLTELLDKSEANGMAPGCGCVVFKGNELIYRHIAGLKDRETGEKLCGNELYYMYSCTKVMTCSAALTLVDKGLLNLDDKVSKYIPEFDNMTLTNGKKAENDIKVLNLFTMSGGLTYDFVDCADIDAVYKATNGRCPTLDIARTLAKRPLAFEPGTKFRYSLCHDVLAAVVEVCSGMKYFDYLKQTFLEPLGMNDTYMHLPESEKHRVATKYSYSEELKRPVRDAEQRNIYKLGSEYESGGAGLITTLDDYAKFLKMLSMGGRDENGREYLKRETIELMRTPVFDDEWQKCFNNEVFWSPGCKYGLGVYVLSDLTAAKSTAHTGLFGWDGAAGAFASIDPDEQITIFYIQHMHGGAGHDYHEKLRNAVYEGIKEE